MPLTPPVLDDRTFEEIFADVRRRIPRYAPEWTDHNESDPGITLLQLFSHLTEMTLYRLNKVPERNYVKFLRMLGVELLPARPARAEITFTLARNDVDSVIVPRRTEVAAADAGGDEPLVFETDEALVALGAKLSAVQAFDGFAYTPETTANQADDQAFETYGAHAREGSAMHQVFETPLPITAERIDLAVWVALEERDLSTHYCVLEVGALPAP
jgi:predicted phage baseplate assembly protein